MRAKLLCRAVAVPLLFCGNARVALAQTVRGTIIQSVTGVPARGAVVTLERAGRDAWLSEHSTLTNSAGAYSIKAPGAGLYRVVARRIGSVPFQSEPFAVAVGQVHVVDFSMEPAARQDEAATLGVVSVRRATPCSNTASGLRIATLWEDARTALLSSEIAQREGIVSRRQVRYRREVDLPLMQIRKETFTVFDAEDADGQTSFRSLEAELLSRDGYWQLTKPGVTEFYGPDANALLSEAFVRDHCFTLSDSVVGNDTLMALAFAPIGARMRRRAPPDIHGTIWFGPASSLSRVEFTWTKLTGKTEHLGGEINFKRLEDGPWLVESWRLRMPQEVVVSTERGSIRRDALVEEGGLMLPDIIDRSNANATVHGIVRQSDGRPFPDARVRIVGTPIESLSDRDGRFKLDGIPLGLQYVAADHPTVSLFGLRLAQEGLVLDSGATREVTLRAPSPTQIAAALCGDAGTSRDRGVLRVVVQDSVSGRPIPGERVRLLAKDDARATVADVSSAATDRDGAVVFCNVTPNEVLVLSTSATSQEVLLRRGDVIVRTLK